MKTHPLLPLCIVAALLAPARAGAGMISNLVSELSRTDYQDYVKALQGFGTRYYNTQGNANARDYLASTLSAFGLSVRLDGYSHDGATRYNVEASLPGRIDPDRIFLIGAHFDSTSPSGATNAPGADDNASGVAAMLEIASVFSQLSFDYSIRFVGFNSEEQGLIGSNAYAAAAEARGDRIVGMLNFDMIGYTGGNAAQDLEVMGDKWLVDTFVADAAAYVSGLPIQTAYANVYGSDHYYFHSSQYAGGASLFAIEDTANEIWGGSNPYYHKTTDTWDRLDWDFAFKVAQAGAATLADLAGVRSVPEPSAVLLLLLGLPGALGPQRCRRHFARSGRHGNAT